MNTPYVCHMCGNVFLEYHPKCPECLKVVTVGILQNHVPPLYKITLPKGYILTKEEIKV